MAKGRRPADVAAEETAAILRKARSEALAAGAPWQPWALTLPPRDTPNMLTPAPVRELQGITEDDLLRGYRGLRPKKPKPEAPETKG